MTTQLTQQPQAGTRVEQVTGVGGEAGTILLGTGLGLLKNEWKGGRNKGGGKHTQGRLNIFKLGWHVFYNPPPQ